MTLEQDNNYMKTQLTQKEKTIHEFNKNIKDEIKARMRPLGKATINHSINYYSKFERPKDLKKNTFNYQRP